MDPNTAFAWSSFWPIWIKYCGVVDEFEMLKSKWNFMSSEAFSALPTIPSTFNMIDNLIHETTTLFKPMFDRETVDKIENFDPNTARARTSDLQERFIELSQYVGLLKFVFFQRTVSNEIPHVVSGLPLSPERTVGNESLYVAADNVAKAYFSCLRKRERDELEWDGVISFIYPILGGYFGGINRPSEYIRKFHVSLTEEGKNFLGCYLFLAHEIGHSTHYSIDRLRAEKNRWPKWFDKIWDDVFNHETLGQNAKFGQEVNRLSSRCSGCRIYSRLCKYLRSADVNSQEYEQCVADLIAYLIGGPSTVFALIDFLNRKPKIRDIPVRPAFLSGYFFQKRQNSFSDLIDAEISKMRNDWILHVQDEEGYYNAHCVVRGNSPTSCFDLFKRIAHYGGQFFASDDVVLFRDGQNQELNLPFDVKALPRDVNSLTSALVKEKFNISKTTEERIKSNLESRTPLHDEDPRNILHCFYLLHREGKTPDYATTLFSLVSHKKGE